MLLFYNLAILLAVAAAYFYYNHQFIGYMNHMFDRGPSRPWFSVATFLINYTLFIAVTSFQFHLTVNWSVFMIFLFLEIWIYNRCSWLKALHLALTCALVGLAFNILLRCGLSLLLNQPLTAFDNHASDLGNLKRYPVFLGFLFSGMVFQMLSKKGSFAKIQLLFQDLPSLSFLVSLTVILYGFLLLNLLAYNAPGDTEIKIWGIKSALFALSGYCLSFYYTCQISQLNQYRKLNKAAWEELLAEKEDEERLRILAFSDPLTGCFNRQYLSEVWDSFEQLHASYSLCMVDLDNLKQINDSLGHLAGDQYLSAAADILKQTVRSQDLLFRYGGDEFLILFADTDRTESQKRMQQAASAFQAAALPAAPQARLSFSYGISETRESLSRQVLLKLADQRTYEQKAAHKAMLIA